MEKTPSSGSPNDDTSDVSAAGGDSGRSDDALNRVTQELESCKRELEKNKKLVATLEEQLRNSERDLPFNEKYAAAQRLATDMERAQEMATMGSWVLEVKTGHVTWTPELHRMFGQDPSCPVPTLEEQEHWYTKRSWDLMNKAISRTSRDGSPYNLELETIRRDGTKGILRSIGEAERDENGQIVRVRGVAQDISSIKESEKQLKLALEEMKAVQTYKDQFLSNMSHEIRTPMNAVVGFASLLRDGDLDDASRNEYIDTIENCSNQLLHLIDDIIDLAKIEAGEIQFDEQAFNVSSLISETASCALAIKEHLNKPDIRIETRIPEGTENLVIQSDSTRLQQMLMNLLGNALKFSHRGTIELGYELSDEMICFYVKDEGIGIRNDRLNLIFDRFEHIEDEVTKYDGTGLGLAITKGLASLLGATLTVDSKIGYGSTFKIHLPLKIVGKKLDGTAAAATKAAEQETRPGKLLIVEDEITNQKFITRALKKSAHEMIYAKDGQEAVEAYRANPGIQLVLMDIRMPKMNGDLAAQEILRFDKEARIVAQTAYAMQNEQEELLKIGFVDYLAKPYRAEDLKAMIHKWIA